MKLNLEVVLSSSIKRKKPWPRFCWLGLEKESVFLLDDKRISEINMVTGRTKRKTPKLYPLLTNMVTMAASPNGVWLGGILVSGELFLWNRDKDSLKMTTAAPKVAQLVTDAQGKGIRLSLQVSPDGMRVLLVSLTGQVCLWEAADIRTLTGVRDGTARGNWTLIQPLEDTVLPSSQDKEASQHSIFVKSEAMGDVCLSVFAFTSEEKLNITFLKIQWVEGHVNGVSSAGYSVRWTNKTYLMSGLSPPCRPVKSRGALLPTFSPDGLLLAIALNQRDPRSTQVLFVSTQNFVSVSSGLGGCGSKKLEIPSKYVRSYWVGSVSWAPGGLFLACVLKRGSLLMLARLGALLSLSTSGCNVDFGPAHFLPLHPLVTYRPPMSAGKRDASLSSSSLSVRDILRQRYSVTWHPRMFYFIVSDGYMATVLRVPERPTPALLIKSLLQDTCQGLEKTRRMLESSQIHAKAWLESMSCLNPVGSMEELRPMDPSRANVTVSDSPPATAGSTLPIFLQDQGILGDTTELLHKVQALFEDDSDLDGLPAGSYMEEGGRLEFASMFDTLHAMSDSQAGPGAIPVPDTENHSDSESIHSEILCELDRVQGSLLIAWALGVSLGGTVEHRERLMRYTLHCMIRLAASLRLIPASLAHTGKKNISFYSRLLSLLRNILSFLPWDATRAEGWGCMGLMVELSQHLLHMLLFPPPESYQRGQSSFQISSQSLHTALLMLKTVSDSLDQTYSLQLKTGWAFTQEEPKSWLSDGYHVPLLEDEQDQRPNTVQQALLPVPQRPSSRLLGVWQWLYRATRQYMEELKGIRGCDGWDEEEDQVSMILGQIQTAIQSTGERLDEGPALRSYTGEQHFLFGFYSQSTDAWRSEIITETKRDCNRRVFKETRLCLALLYGLLFQYRLREAQALGDHMARLILYSDAYQNQDYVTSETDTTPGFWIPKEIHSEAAYAVVQTLGRFMASYFTNQPLYILPPHSVDVLPPLHVPHDVGVGRLVPLCQEKVAGAVRGQQLSSVWTVEYALDLLLLGGLLPEAVWLAHVLGDWKTAASLGLAYTRYSTEHYDFTRHRLRELHLTTVLEPGHIFQAQLESLLGRKTGSHEPKEDSNDYKSFTDSLEGEDWELLQVSVQEILKASVMAGADVLSEPLTALLESAKDLSSSLPALVPSGLYLPAPPLYCPQPAPNTQDPVGTLGELAEVATRHKLSAVLRRLLLLLRSARCCRPAAQWYIKNLRRARHLLHKIKQKYSYPSATGEEEPFPDGLTKFISRSGFFRQGSKRDVQLDPVTIQTIICFRELCGLCWMLHVRDQLSNSCRKYQAARHHPTDVQVSGDSEVRASCEEALRWACRFIPFSRFLNTEEILQDMLLSLVSELPPVSMVAESLVLAFPEEEESVRVPLREKYNSLLQRVRQCTVPVVEKEETGEVMMIVIQDKLRQRRKHLKRLKRHLALLEVCLWEREEDDKGGGVGAAMLGHLPLGASLSSGTLTDAGHPLVYSDGDTATSEALSPDLPSRPVARGKRVKVKGKAGAQRNAVKKQKVIQEESESCMTPCEGSEGQPKVEQLSLPVVGTWEFELEDQEYLRYLELFLSYVLEKDDAEGTDSGCEPPLLNGFCSQLRDRELHSFTFDVLTTLRRRQRDGRHPRGHGDSDAAVFRAGHCYKSNDVSSTPEPPPSTVWSEAPMSTSNLSVTSLPGLRAGKQQGLFGLRQQASRSTDLSSKGGHLDCEPGTVPPGQLTERLLLDSLICVEAQVEPQQGLDPKLEARFPELSRLLEWMVRWADRRLLLGHSSRKTENEKRSGEEKGVMIRVKASAPAVLTALSLMECRYTAALPRMEQQIHVPERQGTGALVQQLEEGWKLERESSVDTGYPGSANTPIGVPDQDPQQGELSLSESEGPERGTTDMTSHHNDQEQVTYESKAPHSQQLSLHDLDMTLGKEDNSGASESFRALSSLSNGNTSGHISSHEPALTVEEKHCLQRDEDVSNTTSQGSSGAASSEAATQLHLLPGVEPVDETVVPSPTGVQPLNTPVVPSLHHSQSATANTPTVTTAPSQPPLAQTEPRQLLNDELFRMVQINFMSLMQVAGAFFINFPFIQQNSILGQSDVNPSNLNMQTSSATNLWQPNFLSSNANISAGPQTQTAVPVSGCPSTQPSQVPVCKSVDPAPQSSVQLSPIRPQLHQSSATRNVHSNGNPMWNSQDMQPLSVQAELPGSPCRGRRRLIPSSEGLLTTMESNQSIPRTPLMAPSYGDTWDIPVPQVSGLEPHPPLLPPQRPVRKAWAPCTEKRDLMGPSHHNPNHDQVSLRRTEQGEEDNRRLMEKESIVPPRHLNLDLPANPSPDPTLESHAQKSDCCFSRPRGSEPPQIFPTLPVHRPPPNQGLRLLHFQPEPQRFTAVPQASLTTTSRSPTIIPVPMGEPTSIQLLHIDPEPRMMLPLAAPPVQATHLISLEYLASLDIGRQKAGETGLRLLSVQPEIQNSDNAAWSTLSYSSKRQKRKEERMRRKGERAEVTFRPNNSIIPLKEATETPVKEEPVADVVESTIEQGFTIPLGSFDSMLTGQRLLDKAVSTTAELHAFASTHKRPPETHDVCTNTEPAQSSAAVLPPDLSLVPPSSLHLHLEPPDQETQETHRDHELQGHQFINVIDLEDGALLQDLPACPNPAIQDVPATQPPTSPTSAELHLMALSVINDAPTAAHTSVTVTEESPGPITPPDVPETLQPVEPSGDPVTVSLLKHMTDPSVARDVVSSLPVPPIVQASACLSEMDAQLAALQRIADHMEMEFANSRLLVHTIETLTPVAVPDVKNKTVSLDVPKRAWTPRPHILIDPNACIDEEEDRNRSIPESFLSPETAAIYRNTSSILHSPSEVKDKMTEAPTTSGISEMWANDTLGFSGLSDVADILDELVKEGALSPSNLGLPTTQAAHLERQDEQHRRHTLQRKELLEEENKKELRIWMRSKQRERLAEYQKQREGMREREYRPYSTSVTLKSTYKNSAAIRKMKLEKDKAMLLEQSTQRTNAACTLINDLLTAPLTLPNVLQTQGAHSATSILSATAQTAGSAHGRNRVQSVSAGGKRMRPKLQSQQAHHWENNERLGRNLHNRLGLQRPVTSLPRDCLSQLTRRGMINNVKGKSKSNMINQYEGMHRQPCGQGKTRQSKSPTGRHAVARDEVIREQREMEFEEEREVVSPWMPPPEICKLLDMDLGVDVAGPTDGQNVTRPGTSWMDWLENPSESASTTLSKLDWAAVESMVAAEGTI